MDIENLSFEEALKKLEKVVEDLEDENIELEESLEKFETGVKLSSHCLSKLNDAERKIEELTRNKEGELVTKEIEIDDKEE